MGDDRGEDVQRFFHGADVRGRKMGQVELRKVPKGQLDQLAGQQGPNPCRGVAKVPSLGPWSALGCAAALILPACRSNSMRQSEI